MSQDDIRAYVRAKQSIETIRKRGAKRKREASAQVKQFRESLADHVPSNVKYLITDVAQEGGPVEVVAFRKVSVSHRPVTAEAVCEAWDALSLDALGPSLQRGESMTEAAMGLLEEELKQRLAVCREYIEVVPRGSKQDPPEMESVHIDAVSPEVRDLAVRLWYAKKESQEAAAEDSKCCKPFRAEVKRLEPIVKEALGDIPGASARVDESDRPVYVRRKTQWVKPKIDFRGEVGPIVEDAIASSGGDELPASSLLVGVEVLDRRETACRVSLDEAS